MRERLTHHLATVALLLVANVFYAAGFAGAWAALAAAVLLDTWFWVRVTRVRGRSRLRSRSAVS
jgi:hypothetical protein